MAHGPDPTHRKLVVHIDIDNASAHKARVTQNFFEHNPLKRLPHPPCSPDISPSDLDFDPFGKVKNALIGPERFLTKSIYLK
jgi:transposase